MREFMDYIQSAFYTTTGWNRDNSYSSLNATSDALLSFPTPRGLRLTLSSLSTPHFATSYQLGTVGVVDGSLSYLYSTVSLERVIAQSDKIPLPDLLRSYRPLAELPRQEHRHACGADVHRNDGSGSVDKFASRSERRGEKKDALAYGRLYLPMSMLEALVVRRLSPKLQMQVSAVSDQNLRNGGTVLGMVQYDEGRYGLEGLVSSDGGLMGLRGLYNFGGDVTNPSATHNGAHGSRSGNAAGNGERERDRIYGRFSTGAELYYGTLNKSGGMSLGARFATLPEHKGAPLTATMTINPLMGNLSWSYAVMAGNYCSFATRMDFNVYSYESDWAIGMELWRKKGAWTVNRDADRTLTSATITNSPIPDRSFQAKMEWRLDNPLPVLDAPRETVPSPVQSVSRPLDRTRERSFRAKMEWRLDNDDDFAITSQSAPDVTNDDDEYSGVLKARLDQHWRIGLLWEGRAKSLLFSLGSGIDLRRLDSPFRIFGLEVQFSS